MLQSLQFNKIWISRIKINLPIRKSTAELSIAAQSPDDVTEEFMNLKDAGTYLRKGIVHGVITYLSPMKTGTASNFSHANLSDGDTQLRLVVFQDVQQKQLASFIKDSCAIALEHCKVKCARQSDEVLLKPTTKVTKSLDVKQFPAEEHPPQKPPRSTNLHKSLGQSEC